MGRSVATVLGFGGEEGVVGRGGRGGGKGRKKWWKGVEGEAAIGGVFSGWFLM